MGKSTSGPDEVDVITMMRAIGALHSGHVALTVSPYGTGSDTGVLLTAGIILDTLPGSSLPAMITAELRWPNRENASFWGAAYRVLWELDKAIGATYEQSELWLK